MLFPVLRVHKIMQSPVLKIAFLMLLALNMTVVCQEHLESDRLVGAHFLFSAPQKLGQLEIAVEKQQPAAPAPDHSEQAVALHSKERPWQHPHSASPIVPVNKVKQVYSVEPLSGNSLESGGGIACAAITGGFAGDSALVQMLNIRGAVWTPLAAQAPALPPPKPLSTASIF